MRTFVAGLVATIIVASAWAPPVGAATIDKGARPLGGPAMQPGQIVVQPPEQILVPAPSGPPVNFVRPELPPVLQGGPKPEFFLAPGVEGIYAQLRTPSRTKPVALAPYEPYRSPATPPDPTKFNLRQIVVKFVEGSAIRLRENVLVVSGEPTATETAPRLARASLEPPMVQADLDDFNKQLQSFGGISGRAAPGVEENDIRLLRQAAERNSRAEQPDPNLFYFVFLPELKPEDADRALQTLMKHRIVEVAYFQPIPFNAVDKPPQTTLTVTDSQGYRAAAPVGIDAVFARNFAGGRGEGIRAADIEAGWNTNHEDLPPMGFAFGVNWGSEHGTAVLGEIAALQNGFGAVGLAPNSMVGWSSVTNLNPFQGIYFYSVGNALLMTGHALRVGDIALIEQHFPNPFAGPCPPGCDNCAQWGYVAVETIPYEHAAISIVSAAGIVVVEAAGNGRTLVTPASMRDSGAIVVGASDTALTPMCWSNFGPRVNVHAWGMQIGSTGYGGDGVNADPTLRANGNDADQWYTRSFGGTSGASPIVVGAAALIQGTRIARGLPPLRPLDMRTLLVSTGTAQKAGTAPNIGPMPNLRAAIATYIPDAAAFVSQTNTPPGASAPSAPFAMTVTFKNTGGASWAGGHVIAIEQSSTGPQFGPLGAAAGAPQAPIDPGQNVTGNFSLATPAQPGSYQLTFDLKSPQGQVLARSPSQTVTVSQSPTGGGPYDAASTTVVSGPGSMKVGLPGIMIFRAQNTGTTVWMPATHGLRIAKSPNISLTQNFVAVPSAVTPSQSATITVNFTCQAQGPGYVSAQMSAQGTFGPAVGQNVVCQP